MTFGFLAVFREVPAQGLAMVEEDKTPILRAPN